MERETDLKAMTPAAIDTVLANVWNRQRVTRADLARTADSIKDLKQRNLPNETAMLARCEAHLAELQAKAAALRAEAAPYEAEYTSRPWRRYFLVTNGAGHVHRGTHCTTCYPTTTYGWLTDLSGCDETAMVAQYGETACTVCFPDAPSLYKQLGGRARIEIDLDNARAARAAKKAEAAAKKAAKAITNPDGSRLRLNAYLHGETIETIATAKMRLTDLAASLQRRDWQPGSYMEAHLAEYRADAARLATALAARLGTTPEAETLAAEKRAKNRGA